MTGPNHMWQKHVSGSRVGHGGFGGHLIRYSSFLVQSLSLQSHLVQHRGELTHWQHIIEFYMTALTDGTNKINLALLIREYLKVCFEQKIFEKKCLRFWRVAVSPWKAESLWSCRAGWPAGPQLLLVLLSQAFLADIHKSKGHLTLGWVPSSVSTGHLNSALTVVHFSRDTDRLQTGKNCDFVYHLEMKELGCFASRP